MKLWILSANKIVIAALVFASVGTFILASERAHATPYGTNITIDDGVNPGGIGIGREDNEVEPGMIQSQAWDLEGFFLNGNNLTIVSGYNFYTGQDNIKAGDIFIDTNGDAVHSPNIIPGYTYAPYNEVSNRLFKYDYVLDINWVSGTFNIMQLNQDSLLKDTEYGAQYNMPSNPWIYVSGGDTMNTSPLSFNTYNKASLSDTGFSGWDGNNNHYVATFDISGIDLSNGAVFHNTMECGNDNLMGEAAPVPEPTTMLLLGLGLVGIAGIRGKTRAIKTPNLPDVKSA